MAELDDVRVAHPVLLPLQAVVVLLLRALIPPSRM